MIPLILTFVLFAVKADLVVKPRDTEAVIGDSTYFDCASNVDTNEVNWHHYAVGAKQHEDTCLYCIGRVHPQYKSRIEVERNASTGNSRMRIKSVQRQDAGRYECQDNGGIGESASAQLVILESIPTCTSNIKPDGVLGTNNCGLEPDTLHVLCHVSYHGNIQPVITWRKSGTEDSVNPLFCQNIGNRVTCNLTMMVDFSLNGVSYICETNRSTTQYNCTSDIIHVIYVKPNNSIKKMVQGAEENVTCSVNSSQSCTHTWKWFDGVEEEIVANGPALVTHKPGWYKCEAECNIRGKQCTVLSKLVHISEAQSLSMPVVIAVSCLLVIAVETLIVSLGCICLRKRIKAKNRHNVNTRQGRLFLNDASGRPVNEKRHSSIGKRNREQIRTLSDINDVKPAECFLQDNLITTTNQSEAIRLNIQTTTTNKSKAIRLTKRTRTTNNPQAIRRNTSNAIGKAICGLTVLQQNIFVATASNSKIEVYDIINLVLKYELELGEFSDPWDIASCNENHCLYVVDCKAEEILGVDPNANGSVIIKWSTGEGYGLLSVTLEANILLAVQAKNKVNEYLPTGIFLREINLGAGISSPRHALQITNDEFIISFGSLLGLRKGICTFTDKPMITRVFKSTEQINLNDPMQLCEYSKGSILVLDAGCSRVLQYSSALVFQKELLSWKDGLRYPWRMCVDKINGLLFVANNYCDHNTGQKNGEFLTFRIK